MTTTPCATTLACALQWVETHSGLAAWMQGLGTVIALALTVLATHYATRQAHRISVQPVASLVRAVDMTLGPIVDHVTNRRPEQDFLPSIVMLSVQASNMAVTVVVFLDRPAYDWPTPYLRRAVEDLLEKLSELSKVCSECYKPEGEMKPLPPGEKADDVTFHRLLFAQGALANCVDRVIHANAEVRRFYGVSPEFLRFPNAADAVVEARLLGKVTAPRAGASAVLDRLWKWFEGR